MIDVVGTLAVIASLTIILGGLPAQIYKNYQRKSCEGLSKFLMLAVSFSYTMWAAYAWLKGDRFIMTAQTPGFFLAAIIIFQMFYYSEKMKRKREERRCQK